MSNKKKVKKISVNYLEQIPKRSDTRPWKKDEKGMVVIEMENKGFYHRIAQRFFKKPKVSYIELDRYGSHVWENIDGKHTVYEIVQSMEDKFPQEKDRMLDRVVTFFATLQTHGFISFVFGLFLMASVLASACPRSASAASATVAISNPQKQVRVGDSFYIVIEVTSDVSIGEVDAYISYNQKKMKFITGGSVISVENKLLHIQDTISEDDYSKKYSVEFEAKRRGKAEFSLLSPFKIVDASEGTQMSVSGNRLSMQVLGAGEGTQLSTPGEGTGTESPGEGTWTEEGGFVEETEPSATPSITDKRALRLSRLSISPYLLSPEFRPGHYRYTTVVDADVTELILSYETYRDTSIVEVYGNENFVTGENLVKLKVTDAQGNRKTYKITVDKKAEKTEGNTDATTATSDSADVDDEGTSLHNSVTKVHEEKRYEEKMSGSRLAIILLAALSMLLLVVIISMFLRLKGYREDGLDDD